LSSSEGADDVARRRIPRQTQGLLGELTLSRKEQERRQETLGRDLARRDYLREAEGLGRIGAVDAGLGQRAVGGTEINTDRERGLAQSSTSAGARIVGS
jgi:hypothetical protein